MTIEVNKAKADLDNAERDIRSLSALNHVISFLTLYSGDALTNFPGIEELAFDSPG